jgi:hypothetical protein
VSIISIKGTARRQLIADSYSTNLQGKRVIDILHSFRNLAASTVIVWNVSLALVRLKETDGPTAYTSLALQVQNAVKTGSLVKVLKAQSIAFDSVTSSPTELNIPSFTLYIVPTALPTSAPTIVAVIPEVSSIRITNSTATSISASITLVKPRIVSKDSVGGFLYCVAMNNGSVPISINSMKATINDASSSVGAMSVLPIDATFPLVSNLTFKGLTALKTYAIFCYVETAIGTGNSISTVLATIVLKTTACCKSISFINSPTFVYGDVSKYLISSESSSYTFAYTLSAAPSNNLRVEAIVMRNGVVSEDIDVTPSLISFGVIESAKISGEFILSGINSSIEGSYVISLKVSGRSMSQYYSNDVTTVVQILSSASPIPAPILVSSIFSESGHSVLINFNSATNRGGILNVSWPCSLLFKFRAASSTTCSWVNSSAIVATFGSVTNLVYLLPTDPIALIGERLKVII